MPRQTRYKTKYPGVFFILSNEGTPQEERVYYIQYRREGKLVEEKAGRSKRDDMTPARASGIRADKIDGTRPTNAERRKAEEAAKEAEQQKWTIDRLWTEYKAHKPDSKNLRTDLNRYENHLKDLFGKKEPSELIQFDIDRLRINLSKKLKPQTVKHILALLKRVIHFGVKKGLCQGTRFMIELPKVNNLKTEFLTEEQIKALLKAIDQDEHPQAGPMLKLALFAGLRRGEMFNLKWSDIDFERGFIHIRDPKGGISVEVPLNDASRQLLENHPKEKFRVKGTKDQFYESEYVFPGREGRKRVDINKQVNEIKKKANLPKNFRPLHGLRHTYASLLASSGQVDLYVIQRLLTHKSPKMTMRYSHLRDSSLKNGSNVAAEFFKNMEKGEEQEVVTIKPTS